MLFCFNAGEVVRVAIEIEKRGLVFYNHAQKLVGDEEVKEAFSALAGDELKHQTMFESLLLDLPEELKRPTVSDLDQEMDLYIRDLASQHVFGTGDGSESELAKIETVEDALKLALRFEKDSVIFYLGMLEVTCEGKARETVSLLIKEEQRHIRRLSLQMRRCSESVRNCLFHWPVEASKSLESTALP